MKRFAAAALLVLLACCSSSTDMSGERRNVGNVTMTFTVVPAAARRGESVRLTIRLVNNGGTSTRLTFPTSQKYDFWITDGGSEVWRWSSGRMFTQDVNHQDIGGQTGAVFSESWIAARTGKLVAHASFKDPSYGGELKGDLSVQ